MPHRGRANADELIATALATGKSHKDAAAASGVSVKTVFRRAADPAFARHVSQLRGAMIATAAGRLADGMTAAVDTLRSLLDAPNDTVKLGAARAVIDAAVRVVELSEIVDRVAALEAQQKTTEGAR